MCKSDGIQTNLPTRQTVLHWPNGELSSGTLAAKKKSEDSFTPSSISGPLANRKNFRRADVPIASRPLRHIETELYAPGRKLGDVQPKLLTKSQILVDRETLEEIAEVAGGGSTGLCSFSTDKFAKLLAGVLIQLEDKCDDTAAVRHAREGLELGQVFAFDYHVGNDGKVKQPWLEFKSWELPSKPTRASDKVDHFAPYRVRGACRGADFDRFSPLLQIVQHLHEGEHVYIQTTVKKSFSEQHALGISVTGMGDGKTRISIVNSNGWEWCLGREKSTRPCSLVISGTMDTGIALEMLANLQNLKNSPAERYDYWWTGIPLFNWLKSGAGNISTDKEATPQKSVDCGIECYLSWLRSVLSVSAYKLIKANTLNILAEAVREKPSASSVLQRLNERITSSLSSYSAS